MGFLKKRGCKVTSANKNACVKPSNNDASNDDRKSSGSSIDELQMALFYSEQEKVKVTPIPTAPPSPPKAKLLRPSSTRSEGSISQQVSAATPPVSPKSLPFSPKTLTVSPSLASPKSLPSSPKDVTDSPCAAEALNDESTLDIGVRLSAAGLEMGRQSLPAGKVALNKEYAKDGAAGADQKPKRKRKNRKRSQSDQPMSPPHTPPPLPPQLIKKMNKERLASMAEEEKAPEEESVVDDSAALSDKDESEDLGLCVRCGKCLASIKTDDMSPLYDEPIYHVLEKPVMCNSCLREERLGYGRELPNPSPCPSPPPRDFPMSAAKDPVYERVESFKRSREDNGERRMFPSSLHFREGSNPDYESISPYDNESGEGNYRLGTLEGARRPNLAYIKEKSANSSSDYESISSFDLDAGMARRLELNGKHKSCSNNSSHDYECIDSLTMPQNIDLLSPDSPPYIPDGATRNKLLKIDSQGYASVLYPQEMDDSWEFDCLNQDKQHQRHSQSSNGSSVTVFNVEAAWKHQLEKGYAPLTVQQSPPHFSRTSSAPSTAAQCPKLPQQPQDYEVPLHLMLPPPPPPMLFRRNGLNKKQPAATRHLSDMQAANLDETDGHLSDVQEEDGSKRAEMVNGNSTLPAKSLSQAQCRVSEVDESLKLRSRIMTAPTLTFQTFMAVKK